MQAGVSNEVHPEVVPLLIGFQPLVLEPVTNRPEAMLFETPAMVFAEQEILFQNSLVNPMAARGLGDGIDPAGGGAVFINPATFARNERTNPAVVLQHLEINHGQIALVIEAALPVTLQESTRRHLQMSLETEDIVRCEQQPEISAAVGETGDSGVTGEAEAAVGQWLKLLLNGLRGRLYNRHKYSSVVSS